MNSKQLTFPAVTHATRVINGEADRVIIGQYEAVMIVKENGHDVGGTITLNPAAYPVTDVECEDGTRLYFDEPFYYINKHGRG